MIILQKLIEDKKESIEIPVEWLYQNVDDFGIDWKLFDFQKEALDNILCCLHLFYRGFNPSDKKNNEILSENKNYLFDEYRKFGLDAKVEKKIEITVEGSHYNFLKNYYKPENEIISFNKFLNRASFWMATGSGKTLVMVKLIALLVNLVNKKLIPDNDILILAPKDEILNQIKRHIEIFNKGSEIKINFCDLKDWEYLKSRGNIINKKEVTVFYYRSDNIADKDTVAQKNSDGKRIDYNSIYNYGKWYLILDEAHKGDKEFSKRQQYFTVLSQNGFLFNFSATFADEIDKITTVYDYKLDTFLKAGYGKKIYITDSEYKNFNKKDGDFSDYEQKTIIAQSLIVFAVIKKHYNEIKKIKSDLYHSPLLITLANSVIIDEADLKMFFKLLTDITKNGFDNNFKFKDIKQKLIDKIEKDKAYIFKELGELPEEFIAEIENLSEEEFFEMVFHTKDKGNVQFAEFKNNSKELVFKHIKADKYFMLIVASDIIKWNDNVLQEQGYEKGESVETSYFDDINNKDNINILMGCRIFSEGWDSNRPNVMNFINLGVQDTAEKYVTQAIGRGIRIETLPNKRKRFDNVAGIKDNFTLEEIRKIEKYNGLLESLFIFATNKAVIQKIIEDLDEQSDNIWRTINNINKQDYIDENKIPLLIPTFKEAGLNERPFWIGTKEKEELEKYVKNSGPKVLLLKNDIKMRTYNMIGKPGKLITDNKRRKRTPENILYIADNYFNQTIKELDEIKILDREISHFKQVKSNVEKDEIEEIEKELITIKDPKDEIEKLKTALSNNKITIDEYTKKIQNLSKSNNSNKYFDDIKRLAEHYYTPILCKKDTTKFQHIIKHESEIKFLENLIEYLKNPKCELKKYEWWYFSKIEENIDKISIPYFDEQQGRFREFYPDFIFWLKKNNDYFIVFIDPKGVEHTKNPSDKIRGFKKMKNDFLKRSKNIKVNNIALYMYNKDAPDSEFKEYWCYDFDKIFSYKNLAAEKIAFIDINNKKYMKYKNTLPVYSMKAAAGRFGDSKNIEVKGWVEVNDMKLTKDMFVVKIKGNSMRNVLHDGDYAIFKYKQIFAGSGEIVLVQHQELFDSESDGSYSVKKYYKKKDKAVFNADTDEPHIAKNTSFEIKENLEKYRIIAEFVTKLGNTG